MFGVPQFRKLVDSYVYGGAAASSAPAIALLDLPAVTCPPHEANHATASASRSRSCVLRRSYDDSPGSHGTSTDGAYLRSYECQGRRYHPRSQ
jgi:hypothetical protein